MAISFIKERAASNNTGSDRAVSNNTGSDNRNPSVEAQKNPSKEIRVTESSDNSSNYPR